MPLKDRLRKWKEYEEEEEEHSSLMIWETAGDIGSLRRKLKFGKDGNDSLSIDHKEKYKLPS